MRKSALFTALTVAFLGGHLFPAGAAEPEGQRPRTLNVEVPAIRTDPEIRYDYDIVYVRAPRDGETQKRYYTDFSSPLYLEPGADLMLLHPDGTEELLVEGGIGAITDPVVGFDGEWVYYTRIYNTKDARGGMPGPEGADIYKIHVPTRRIVRLTNQRFTPNTGAARWSSNYRRNEKGKNHFRYGVFNMGPCPLPGGRIAFTSNRDGFLPSRGYPKVALQLFVMDDRDASIDADEIPQNLDKIGHLNIAGALHPVVLRDGRIIYSSLESEGIRQEIAWGIWSIHPDGTNWAPVVSAFDPIEAANGFHFQTQLSDGSIVVEEYYNLNNSGFGALVRVPPPKPGYPAFGPAYMRDARNPPWRYGRHYNGVTREYRIPFMPTGSVALTPFTHGVEGPADPADLDDEKSPRVGKFTHPSAAPDNHLLTVYSPGPVNHQYRHTPLLDGGIYLLKGGRPAEEPADLRLIKNDPQYNESWPRALVPYRRIYGVAEPQVLEPLANDGTLSPHLPAGTPFGLVGTSSFYKRETFPNGVVPEGSVTSQYAGGNDPWRGIEPFTSHGNGLPLNWSHQGADAGLYENSEIHAVRILAMEPTTDRQDEPHAGRRFYSHPQERFRILGEIPLRKFADGKQPRDPDGNPDTSFLAKIPADTAFTFQTLDARGMVLNMSQTWHQLRPGEVRVDCGGCHAHSQQPTEFAETLAARPDYKLWDLVNKTPMVVQRDEDQSGQQWDTEQQTGLRLLSQEIVNVEYYRDIQPIFRRSCIACHSGRNDGQPAGNLDLDADHEMVQGDFPGTYFRLAMDDKGQFGHKPLGTEFVSWGYPNASRYVRKLQSRRSLLTWKIYGERFDGFTNADHPSESRPGAGDLVTADGQELDPTHDRRRHDVDLVGSVMPPPEAVAGGKVAPLTDADRRMITRWIDLGCPIDFDYDPQSPGRPGYGWMLDDNRPIVTLSLPRAGANPPLEKIQLGMHDYYSGLDAQRFRVFASFTVGEVKPGHDLSKQFRQTKQGVWELALKTPIANLSRGQLVIFASDRAGNVTRLERTFSVGGGVD